jgi:hypothetical protein
MRGSGNGFVQRDQHETRGIAEEFLAAYGPVMIDASAPPSERNAKGNIVLPGGRYAHYCEECGEHYSRHDDGECPTIYSGR